jgi:hypothetical protein
MCKQLQISTIIIFQVLVVSGCNLPTSNTSLPITDSQDVTLTMLSETWQPESSPTSFTETTYPVVTITPNISNPTISLEPTNSLIPTEIPTSTDNPKIIYSDDFSDKRSWYTFEGDQYGFRYTDEGYHIYNEINMGLIWSIREQDFSGVAIEVDGTRLSGSEDSFFGVVCSFSNEGDNYYAMVIGDNGFYGMGLMEDGEYEFVETGVDEDGMIRRGQGVTNRIRGVCNDDHFLVYANGELMLDVWDDTLENGIIGLVVGNQHTGSRTEFRFNDFVITWP